MSEQYDPSFNESFKKYDETKTYFTYEEQELGFDPKTIELENITDIYSIMNEINKLSYKLFLYGSLCDSQNRVLQQVEDEFERWTADIYAEEKIDDKQYKSDKAKERYIMVKHKDAFWQYKNNISNEKYKLSLLKRVVKSVESYGFKLHDLKDYNLSISRNS